MLLDERNRLGCLKLIPITLKKLWDDAAARTKRIRKLDPTRERDWEEHILFWSLMCGYYKDPRKSSEQESCEEESSEEESSEEDSSED